MQRTHRQNHSILGFGLGLALLAAALPQAARAQAHYYDLTKGYADAYGGPALTPNGGTQSSAGYAFTADQGPTLTGALSSLSSYSIEMVFSLTGTGGYQKLLEFTGTASDNGLYNLNGTLDFYPFTNGSSVVFTPGQTADVLLTRNGATNVVTGYVNGVQQIQFPDTTSDGVFATNSLLFFQDDTHTGGSESGPGVLKSLSINGGVAAPEPSQTAALGLGVLGLAGLALKARRRRHSA